MNGLDASWKEAKNAAYIWQIDKNAFSAVGAKNQSLSKKAILNKRHTQVKSDISLSMVSYFHQIHQNVNWINRHIELQNGTILISVPWQLLICRKDNSIIQPKKIIHNLEKTSSFYSELENI